MMVSTRYVYTHAMEQLVKMVNVEEGTGNPVSYQRLQEEIENKYQEIFKSLDPS